MVVDSKKKKIYLGESGHINLLREKGYDIEFWERNGYDYEHQPYPQLSSGYYTPSTGFIRFFSITCGGVPEELEPVVQSALFNWYDDNVRKAKSHELN